MKEPETPRLGSFRSEPPGSPSGGRRGGRRHWPVPDVTPSIPASGSPGSFWEDRGDRRHVGIDIYAPAGSRVVSIEAGTVIASGIFTSPQLLPHWNRTEYVTIAHASGIVCRYAELRDVVVAVGSRIQGGDTIGHVGEVLNLSRVREKSPPYIRALSERGRTSMLHLEAYTSPPVPTFEYLGGNWFSPKKPVNILDPGLVLLDTLR